MKRFSFREFGLVCSPLLIVAAVGLAVSRGKLTLFSKPDQSLHLEMQIQKPTTLDMFNGVDTVCVVRLKGDGTTHGFGRDPWRIGRISPGLEFRSNDADPWTPNMALWKGVVKEQINGDVFKMNFCYPPPGQIRFFVNAGLVRESSASLKPVRSIIGVFPIDRTKIKPPDFLAIPRKPLIHLSSVKILTNSGGYVRGEAVFEFLTPLPHAPFEFAINSKSGYGYSSYESAAANGDLTPETSKYRSYEWGVWSNPGAAVKVAGTANVNNCWPLAFEIGPFTCAKIQEGQIIKFKSWPAPVPSP